MACMKKTALLVLLVMVGWVSAAFAQTQPILRASTQPTTRATTQPISGGPAAVVEVRGEINDYTKTMLFKRVEQARKAGAKTIILRMDTPGGSVGTTMQITRFLKLENSDLNFIAYIEVMAYSAGHMD